MTLHFRRMEIRHAAHDIVYQGSSEYAIELYLLVLQYILIDNKGLKYRHSAQDSYASLHPGQTFDHIVYASILLLYMRIFFYDTQYISTRYSIHAPFDVLFL